MTGMGLIERIGITVAAVVATAYLLGVFAIMGVARVIASVHPAAGIPHPKGGKHKALRRRR